LRGSVFERDYFDKKGLKSKPETTRIVYKNGLKSKSKANSKQFRKIVAANPYIL
jgi:hypothetical protein